MIQTYQRSQPANNKLPKKSQRKSLVKDVTLNDQIIIPKSIVNPILKNKVLRMLPFYIMRNKILCLMQKAKQPFLNIIRHRGV